VFSCATIVFRKTESVVGILQCEPEFAIHVEDNGLVAQTIWMMMIPRLMKTLLS
jgi:hypothetical protein